MCFTSKLSMSKSLKICSATVDLMLTVYGRPWKPVSIGDSGDAKDETHW